MIFKVFQSLPQAAREIRKKVFTDEQGFTSEFDDKDEIAVHLVAFEESGAPIATCRIFKDCENDFYVVGRLAVIKEYRGKNIGSHLLNEAEKYVKEKGGKCIVLHAQQRVTEFYKKSGFTEFGDVDYEDYCPHIHMKKYI
ncbi:MAG: GNAT family N-acetyltransferase [Clostridia bacterium]|nr:GNAT family N-acetyltransferase [Clostridia bacterium]